MATASDVARLVEGAGDYDEVIRNCQAAGLATQTSVGTLLVGHNVAVSQVGGNARANAYWIVYDVNDPEKSKVKVKGATP
jgi:hypothetical protein